MTMLWLLLPAGVAVVAVLVGRRLTRHHAAPEEAAPVPAGAVRRLVGSVVNWVAALGVAIGLGRASVSFGQILLVAPVCIFAVSSFAGVGPGELVAGTRVVDAANGRRLAVAQGLVRVVVQLVTAYAVALSGWLVGLAVASGVAEARGSWNAALPLAFAAYGALAALATAEPVFVRITPQRTTPWDAAARSAVVPRHRTPVTVPPTATVPPAPPRG